LKTLPAFVFVFFLKNPINKEKIFHISISVLIFILIVSVVALYYDSDSFLSRADIGTRELTDSPETEMYGSTINLVSAGFLTAV